MNEWLSILDKPLAGFTVDNSLRKCENNALQ